ncbi:hypothetical protein Pcinc_012438 [Petrolisthes cinctipes]|uniref:Uncharacterized protein n=1 Tax=Petrolisthes cinctipes TaxID=88211 RepID=A0AAE1KTK7_PETCI|nr:hypothetical protein Pcinc_012438 [Petrolisthes cinctipes]
MGTNLLHSKLSLLSCYKKPDHQHLHDLQVLTLGDLRPSILWQQMKLVNSCCDFPLPTTILRYMYLQKLPPQVRITLAALDSTTTNLDFDFALAADRMLTQYFIEMRKQASHFSVVPLLFVKNLLSSRRFLIDTRASTSILPHTAAGRRRKQPSFDLLAANGTTIAIYGTINLTLDLDYTNISDILQEFPGLTDPSACQPHHTRKIFHHIETTGPPVYSRPRRLPPD